VDDVGEGGSRPAGDIRGPSSHGDKDRLMHHGDAVAAWNVTEGQGDGTT
jgi:hypothetical protein